MKYKAIFCDMDGTLLIRPGNELPTLKVKEAIGKAQEIGVHVGSATARPGRAMMTIFNHLGLRGPSITSGGAEIVDTSNGNRLWESIIDLSLVDTLCKIIEKFKVTLWIQDDGINYDYTSEYKPHKPFVIVAHMMNSDIADKIIKECSVFQEISIYRVPTYQDSLFDVHISHKNANKDAAILEIIKMLGISREEIIGVGDGQNDIPLLQACGLKVAMGNAVPELIEIADYVTDTVENDGVAKVIEEFILNNS